jgi:hypothetical protein
MESQNKYLSDEPVPMMLDWRIINDGRKYKIQANDSSGQYRVEINRSLKRMDRDRLYNHNVTRVVVSASDPDLPSLGYKPKIALTIISSGKYAKKIVPNKAEEYLNGHWLALLAERIVEVVSCINSNEYGYNELIIEFSHGMYTKLDKKFTAAIDALRFTKEMSSRIQPGRIGITSALLSMLKLSTKYSSTDSLIQEAESAGLTELTSVSVQNSSNNDYIFFSTESVFLSLVIDTKKDITKQYIKGTSFYFSPQREVKPSTISFIREVLKKHPKTIDLLNDLNGSLLGRSKYSFIIKLPVDIIDNESLKRSVSRFVNRDGKYLTNMNKMMHYVENWEVNSVCLLVTLQALYYQFKINDPAIRKHEDKASKIIAPLMSLKPTEQDAMRLRRCISMVLAIAENLDNHIGTSMFNQVVQGTGKAMHKNMALVKKEIPNCSKNDNLSVEINHHLFNIMADMALTLVVILCETAGVPAPSINKPALEDFDDFRDLKDFYSSLAPVIPVIQGVMQI